VDNELEVIRDEMEEKRASLAAKLEALETQVRDTVQSASEAVSSTVDGVKDAVHSVTETVETVSEKVTETFDDVKSKVTDTVHTVAEAFDVRRYVERAPWTSLGVSVAVGFAAGALLPSWNRQGQMTPATVTPPGGGNGRPSQPSGPSWKSEVTSTVGEALGTASGTLGGLAIGTLLGVVRDLLTKNVPHEWQGELTRMVDDIGNKLGARPMDASWLTDLLQGRHNGQGPQEGSSSPERRETFTPRANV
jgi:ElaB/YqjD/DUF883 family membrane-anchored ribosome-binding protein